MKILWLSIDRTNGYIWFDDFRQEVSKLADVTYIMRSIGDLKPGNYCYQVMNNQIKPTPLLDNIDLSQFDLIFTDSIFGFMTEQWRKIKIPKAVLIEDQHGPMVKKYASAALDVFKFDIFVVRYFELTSRFWPRFFTRKVIWSPHSINPNQFNKITEDKTIQCLSVGENTPKFYPFRANTHKLLQHKSYYKRITPSDGYKGNSYVELLNNSLLTITCPVIYNYPIRKFIEVPACNSITISPRCDELINLGFEENKNILFTNENSIINDVEKHLKTPDKLKEMAESGYKVAHSLHTTQIRAIQFLENVFRSI